MSSIAYVYPGQGSQSVGMGRDLAMTSAAAAAVWTVADDALGESISDIAWNGPAERLDRTENSQPAILAASIALLESIRAEVGAERDLAPRFSAGHSMGQYSALVASGVITLADGIRLVRARGRCMQASGTDRDGAMAAIIGLPDDRLDELVERGSESGTFVVANRNAPGQVVVSGERPAIDAGAAIAKDLGAKRAIVLPVSVAAHSPLMAGAAEAMRTELAGVMFEDPHPPLLANADATVLDTAEACRSELITHLTAGVDWVAAIERMTRDGVTTFVEVGPGKVLTGLIKRIAPDATVIPLDDPAGRAELLDRAAGPTPA
jgi:[acyl-carrier-protein] S-malonyltransferase